MSFFSVTSGCCPDSWQPPPLSLPLPLLMSVQSALRSLPALGQERPVSLPSRHQGCRHALQRCAVPQCYDGQYHVGKNHITLCGGTGEGARRTRGAIRAQSAVSASRARAQRARMSKQQSDRESTCTSRALKTGPPAISLSVVCMCVHAMVISSFPKLTVASHAFPSLLIQKMHFP